MTFAEAESQFMPSRLAHAVDPGLIRLRRMGWIYLLAAVCQASWIGVVIAKPDTTLEMLGLGLMGWALGSVWLGMLVATLFLGIIGSRLVRFAQKRGAVVSIAERRFSMIRTLLLLGIVLDVIIIPFLPEAKDWSAVLFLSGFMGARVLQANLEAIFAYYNV